MFLPSEGMRWIGSVFTDSSSVGYELLPVLKKGMRESNL